MEKQELLHEQTSANTADNSNFSKSQDDTSFEFVEKTPFAIMKVNGLWNITMGNYIVKEGIESKEKAKNLIRLKDWQVLLVATAIYQEMIKDFEKREKEQENTNN
jgi:hypothetical protein